MDQLLEPSKVKKAYRKYMMHLHPDKTISEKNAEKDYVANSVFAAITLAYNKFKVQEHM